MMARLDPMKGTDATVAGTETANRKHDLKFTMVSLPLRRDVDVSLFSGVGQLFVYEVPEPWTAPSLLLLQIARSTRSTRVMLTWKE